MNTLWTFSQGFDAGMAVPQGVDPAKGPAFVVQAREGALAQLHRPDDVVLGQDAVLGDVMFPDAEDTSLVVLNG